MKSLEKIISQKELEKLANSDHLLIEKFGDNNLICSTIGCCPGAFNDRSEQAQRYGCLPTIWDIVEMKVKHNKTGACHSNESKPCLNGLKAVAAAGYDPKPEGDLLTLQDDWESYIV